MVICKSRSIEAIDASYEYMCGSGYKLFEKHADCFAEVKSNKILSVHQFIFIRSTHFKSFVLIFIQFF